MTVGTTTGALGVDAVRFNDNGPISLTPSKPSQQLSLVVQVGLEVHVVLEQSGASTTVACDSGAPSTTTCTLLAADAVIRTITLAWDGNTAGAGFVVASAVGVAPQTLRFEASAKPAATGVSPAELTFGTSSGHIREALTGAVVGVKQTVPLIGEGPHRVASASLTVDKTGVPRLVADHLDTPGTYTWTIDSDGDGKADLTVKVSRRRPMLVCLGLLALGAGIVGGLVWLRDRKLAGLLQKKGVETLRHEALASEAQLAKALTTAAVGHDDEQWTPATEGKLADELDRLAKSVKPADLVDGAKFNAAAAAVGGLKRIANAADRAAHDLVALRSRHPDRSNDPLLGTAVAILRNLDFSGIELDQYSVQAALFDTLASNLAVADRIDRAMSQEPDNKAMDDLYNLDAGDSATAAALRKLQATVMGTTPTVPAALPAGFLTYAFDYAQPGAILQNWLLEMLGSWEQAALRGLHKATDVTGLRVAFLIGAGAFAILSGLASVYYPTDTWGSAGDILKAITWAGGATFAVDALTKIAISGLSGPGTASG